MIGAATRIVEELGINDKDTPERYAKALKELSAETEEVDLKAFPLYHNMHGRWPGFVFKGPLRAASLCPHHLLPYLIEAYFAYIPRKDVVGISKPGRLLEWCCKKQPLQEYVGHLFLTKFSKSVENEGGIILLKGQHLCETIRGARQRDSLTMTLATTGVFDEGTEQRRAEFWSMVRIAERGER